MEKILYVGLVVVGFGLGVLFYEIPKNKYDVNKDGIVDARNYMEIKNYIMREE